jgi:hypothetical protein
MRFFKRMQGPDSPEHTAFVARLNAVTERCKVALPSSAGSEEPSKPAEPVQRFWTPHEAAENCHG